MTTDIIVMLLAVAVVESYVPTKDLSTISSMLSKMRSKSMPSLSRVIGTRGSPLAIAQAHETKGLLELRYPDVQWNVKEVITKVLLQLDIRYISKECITTG